MGPNADAVLRWFDEHHAPLFRFAWRLTGSQAEAEDVVQECFLSLLQPGCGFDGKRPVLTYLYGAVRNQAMKRMRVRLLSAGADFPPTPESEYYSGEVSDAVARAIHELPEGQREALILAHYEQMPLAEIAALLNLEIGAVKSRIQRARATLREKLAPFAPSPQRQEKES